jgi:peptidoglycan-associated lipoprotein
MSLIALEVLMKQGILITLSVVLFGVSSLLAQSPSASESHNEPLAAGSGASPSTPTPLPNATEQQLVEENVKDIHFDFNRADLRPADQSILESDAQWLKAHPGVIITIEGDADDRGDIVYNLSLSDQRATTTEAALVSLGVPANQIEYATGWGKLYPVCTQDDDSCWQQNRRAHFEAW